MLIDNITPQGEGKPTTILEFLEKKLGKASSKFQMVTGYYSLQTLAKLLPLLDKYQDLELVLGHIAGESSNPERFYLTQDSLKIGDSLDFIHNK